MNKHKNKNDLLAYSYLGNDEIEKAEIRRLEMWFDKKFFNEVSKYILEERVYNTFNFHFLIFLKVLELF